jgi:cytochrome b subunit of formate dehydrogenase
LRIDTAVHLQTAGQSLSLHRETIQEKEMSRKAKLNYTIDVIIGLAFILSALSGLVLFFVPGGYQGGLNPYYLQPALLLNVRTWKTLHTWGSIAMIAGVGAHLVLHWSWIVCVSKRLVRDWTQGLVERKADRECPILGEGR